MRTSKAPLILLLLGALAALPGCRKEAASVPAGSGAKVGQLAPDVTIPDEAGKPVVISALRGQEAVMLAFYPKDFTGG